MLQQSQCDTEALYHPATEDAEVWLPENIKGTVSLFWGCPYWFFGGGLILPFVQILSYAWNPVSMFGVHLQKCKLNNISVMFESCPTELFHFSDFRKK